LADKFGLIVTCGSDFHGELVKPDINIGDGSRELAEGGERGILTALKLAAKR